MSKTKTERRVKPPKYLYKYQPFTVESIANLKDRQLWFSKPSNFNDPYDCAVHPASEISDDEYKKVFQAYRGKIKDKDDLDAKYLENGRVNSAFVSDVLVAISESFQEQKQKILNHSGVACFSEENDNLLMWAHYSQGHKGFCLEFDTTFELFKNAKPVLYSRSIPIVKPVLALLGKSGDDILKSMITTKADCWSYEKEWRIFHNENSKLYGYGVDCLKGVYFGVSMDYSQKEIISMILQGSPTKLYEMEKSDNEFRLTYKQVEYIPYSYVKDKK